MRKKAAALLLFLFVALIAALSHGAAKSDKISLNFDDVDLPIFLKTMSEITGKSFTLCSLAKSLHLVVKRSKKTGELRCFGTTFAGLANREVLERLRR